MELHAIALTSTQVRRNKTVDISEAGFTPDQATPHAHDAKLQRFGVVLFGRIENCQSEDVNTIVRTVFGEKPKRWKRACTHTEAMACVGVRRRTVDEMRRFRLVRMP